MVGLDNSIVLTISPTPVMSYFYIVAIAFVSNRMSPVGGNSSLQHCQKLVELVE